MKLYSMNWSAVESFPSTPTLVHWFRAMRRLEKLGHEKFSPLEVMQCAIDNGWETKQEGNDEKLMTSWAYYVKQMKDLGLQECETVGVKKTLTLEELLGE
jgi:hypothetical protein